MVRACISARTPLAKLPYGHAPQFAASGRQAERMELHARPEFVTLPADSRGAGRVLQVLVEELGRRWLIGRSAGLARWAWSG
ncbi:MAG: hypothetical protein R3B91_16075 [Planctomycetaceae bacterium]